MDQEINTLEELMQKVTVKLYNESNNKEKFSQEFFDKVFGKNNSKEIDDETYTKIKKALSLEYKKIVAIFLNTWKSQLKIIYDAIFDKDLCKKNNFPFQKFADYNKSKIYFRNINAVLSRLDYVASLKYELKKDKYFEKYVDNPKKPEHFKKMTIFYEGKTALSLFCNEDCLRWKKDKNGNPIGNDVSDYQREENFGFDEALKKLNAFDDGIKYDSDSISHIEDYAIYSFIVSIMKNICEKINGALSPILKEHGQVSFNVYNYGDGPPDIMLGYQINFKTKVSDAKNISTEGIDLMGLMKFASNHNTDELAKVKKNKSYKCPICKKVKYEFPKLLYNHVLKEHSDEIPENMPVEQYVFNVKNKKTGGKCVICGKPTDWNPKTNKYHRICSEECKKKYIEEARKRLMKTYGTDDLSKDPDHQKKMLDNRKISKPYKFQDGKEIIANSSYEYDFLRFMEQDLGYGSEEIQPCNITFNYEFEGKSHFYIPDFYLPDFNLIVEVKDEGSKANFIPRMRLMDLEKYKKIIEVGKYNFITVVGKDYSKLIEVLDYLKNKDYNNDENKTLIIEIDKKNYGNLAVPKKYKLEQAIRTYESLSREHYILRKDINRRLRYLNSLEILSTEGLKENWEKIWNFIKTTVKKLIDLIDVFIKRIIAKIYEITMRSKEGLYVKFKSKVFNSVDIIITERKINPNLIVDMKKYIQTCNDWVTNIKYELESKKIAEMFDAMFQEKMDEDNSDENDTSIDNIPLFGNDYKSEMMDLIKELQEEKGIDNFLLKMFYENDKKDLITIKDYFNCQKGEIPQQIEILSDKFKDALVEFKTLTTQLSSLLKKVKGLMEGFKEDDIPFRNTFLAAIRFIVQNISVIQKTNYLFFIEAVKVRGKVAKYLLKGSLGKMFDDIEPKNLHSVKYREKAVEFNKWRKVPDFIVERDYIRTFDNDTEGRCRLDASAAVSKNFFSRCQNGFMIFYEANLKNESQTKYFNKVRDICIQINKSDEYSNTNHLFQQLGTMLKIPFDLSHVTFFYFDIYKDIDKITLKCKCFFGFYDYKMEKDDILYHTTEKKNLKYLDSYSRGRTITHTRYPEPRTYFGLNQITTKPGHLTDKDWKGLLKQVAKFSHQVFGGRNDARNLRVYQATNIQEGEIVFGDPEMLVNLESSEAIFQEFNGRATQSVYVANKQRIEVEDITDIISTIDEIYKKE